MTGREKNENQIRRSKTLKTIRTGMEEEQNLIKKSPTMKQIGLPEEPVNQPDAELQKDKMKDPELLDGLKKKAEKLPVLLPAVRILEQENPADEIAVKIAEKAGKVEEQAEQKEEQAEENSEQKAGQAEENSEQKTGQTEENSGQISEQTAENSGQAEEKVETAEEKTAKKTETKQTETKQTETKQAERGKQVRGNKLEDAMEILRELHQNLEAEEKSAFTAVNVRNRIGRTKYDSLSASDLKKRAKEALKRRKNAQKVMEYDFAHSRDEKTYSHIDQETLKKHIASFRKLPSKPYDMDTDEKFLANLEKNYQLCDVADHMKHWLKEASDQGYMPKGEDMEALQEKIAAFSEVKNYMDHQKDLMKNPYYQYFAKQDISYTDKELNHLAERTEDPILKNYLMNVKTIRSLKYVRSKGMKSTGKYAKEEGKRQAEILGTRQEKKLLVSTLSEKVMGLGKERRFLDKDYDAGFSGERFQKALADFKALNLKELHFAGVKDIVEHFDENQQIFDRVHDIEQLMMAAINRGLAPSDQEIITIRAKIDTLLLAEKMSNNIQKKMLSDTEGFLNGTYKELEDSGYTNAKAVTDAGFRHEPPKFGQDMNRYFRSLLKNLQQEHKDRETKIKLGYGLSHPERKTDGGDEGTLVPGVIPEEELAFRSADFQKNAFRVDYLRNLEHYLDSYADKVYSVVAVHAKKTGRGMFDFGRTLFPFVVGKGADEIIRVVDTMQVGTAEEKEKLYLEMADEAFQYNFNEYDSRDPAVFYRNAAMRARKAKILNNIAGSTGDAKHYIRDAEIQARMKAYYQTSCGNAYLTAMSQGADRLGGKGIWYKDFFVKDPTLVRELGQELGNRLEDEEQGSIRIGDETFRVSASEFNSMDKTHDRIYFMHQSGLSAQNKERAESGIRDKADIMLYDELKAAGYHKTVTDQQLEELKTYYRKHEQEYKKTGVQLVDETRKILEKDFPGIENKVKARPWILQNMNILARSTYGRKTDEKAEEKDKFTEQELRRSADLYKGLFIYSSKDADAKERGECARAIEEMFGAIMDFDLSRLSFRSYADLIKEKADDPNRFRECLAVTRLAMEAQNYLAHYRKLREDEEVSCRLNAVHVDEVAARISLLMSAEALFDERFLTEIMDSPELKASGYSLDEILHLSEEQIRKKHVEAVQSGEGSKIQFWTNVMSTTSALKGFDIGIPATVVEEYYRKQTGLLERSRATETRNILKGAKRVLDDKKEGEILLTKESEAKFAARFSKVAKEKDYTVSKRESNLYNSNSRLSKKRIYFETLQKNGNDVANAVIKARSGLTLKNRMAVGEERIEDISAFMKGDAAQDNILAERYADQEKRYELMDEFTREIMEMNLSLKVDSDEQFAAASGDLEKISRKVIAYDRLLKANPDYPDRLRNRKIGSSRTDLEKVEEKTGHMLAISDYYRARKLLLSDHYFILHYDDELSAAYDDKQNEDQRRIAELLRLLSGCAKRLENRDFREGEHANIDAALSRAEMKNRRQAYLTARPDLTKADPAKVYQANKDITGYLKAAGLDEMGGNNARDEIGKADDKKPFPQAEKHRTEDVGNFIDTIREYARLANPEYLKPQEKKLYDAINEKLIKANGQAITSVRYHDPVTGEDWDMSTNLKRLNIELIKQYGVGMPEEEILEILDGLLLSQREELDLSDEKVRQYVRERWLDSMQKLFYMEYNAVKQYENTYGTLLDEMPIGCFFASLGSGLKEYVIKNRFGQDVAQICDYVTEKNCLVDGEKMAVTQLLVKHGKLPSDVVEDCYHKNTEYYQTQQACINNFIMNPAAYASGDFRAENDFAMSELYLNQYTKDHFSFGGPKMTMAERRKLWKKTREFEKDRVLTGGPNYLAFQKDTLDLYTSDEKKELKKDRAKDLGLMHYYQYELDERKEKLLSEAGTILGEGISEELLTKLIEFHPRMMKEKADDKTTEEYYNTVKQFAGIGIPEDQQDKAKKEAAEKLFDQWEMSFRYGCTVNSVQELMGYPTLSEQERRGQARTKEDEVLEGSKLYIGEARHRMYESVISLFASGEDTASLLSERKQKNLMEKLKRQVHQEIFRAMVRNKDFLDLKDIGSQRKTYQEKMIEELFRFRSLLKDEKIDLFRDILDQDGRTVMEYFGIPCPKETTSAKTEEKKAEKKVEKKEEKKAEDKTAEEKKTGPEIKEEEIKVVPVIRAEEKTEKKDEEKIGDHLDEEIQRQENLYYEMPKIEYRKNVRAPEKGEHVAYENQGDSTYCWACVMSGLMNAKAGKKVSDLGSIRKRPIAVPAFEESGIEKKENYDAGVALVNGMYDGTAYGNPAIFGDYIFDKLPDTAVRTAIISREPGRLEYCKRRFLETLSKNLEKGPVGFLHAGHFVLVRGLEGDTLKVNDSMSGTPDTLQDFDRTVSELFASAGQQLELVWLEDLRGQEKQIADEFNLDYNEEKWEFALKQDGIKKAGGEGEISYDQPKNEQTILHRNGVEAAAQYFDDVVFSSIYVPKKPAGAEPAGKAGEKAVEDPVKKVAEPVETAEEKAVGKPEENAAGKPEEKAVEKPAEKAEEKSVDDVVQGLVQDTLGAALQELEQEEAEESLQEEKKEEKIKEKQELPENAKEYYEELKRIGTGRNAELFKTFRYVHASDPDSFYSDGSQESRYMSRQVGMLSYFGKLDDSNADDAFFALMVNTQKASVRQKTLKAREYERIFEQILDFDIRKLNLKHFTDAFHAENKDASVMTAALFDFHPSTMRDYASLLKDPAVKTSLSEDEFKEVQAKWDMMHSNFAWLSDAPKYVETIRKHNVDVDEVLHMSTERLLELIDQTSSVKKGDRELNAFYVWMMATKGMWEQSGYKGPGDDAENLLKTYRASDLYQLPKDRSYAESAKAAIRARLAEDEGKIFDRYVDYTLEPSLKKQLEKVEKQFKDTTVSKTALSDMKKTTKAIYEICTEQDNAISKSTFTALQKATAGTIDQRGIGSMLRPVKLDKEGLPATEQDRINRELNEKDAGNLSTNKLSDRVDFLERVVGEAREIMFTTEELKDHKFILKNRERAIRHVRLMHNLLNLYTRHEDYFLNQAPPETRDFMFMFGQASEYVNFQEYHIQMALQKDGLGGVPHGGSSYLQYALDYNGFFDYKTVVSVNKKMAKLGMTTSQFYYGNIITLKPVIEAADEEDKLDIPQMLDDAMKTSVREAKDRKITDSVLSPATRILLSGELPKGTVNLSDTDYERIMAKYLDCFAAKNRAKLSKKTADRKKLQAYIDEYKKQNDISNAQGLIDDLSGKR